MIATETWAECLQNIEAMSVESEEAQSAPYKEFRQLALAGALSCVLPGERFDFNKFNFSTGLLNLLKDVGRANLSVGRIFEGHINALYLVHLFGTDEQKNTWYDKVRRDDALFGVWNTQPKQGIVLRNNGDDFILEGSKIFCSGAGLLDYALITGDINARDRKGWQMLVVDMQTIPEDRIDPSNWKTIGMRASCSYDVDFSGHTIQQKDLLAQPGDYLKQPWFSGGAIRFAAVQLGGAEAIFYHTKRYLQQLNRTSDVFQKQRLSKMATEITTGQLWIEQAARNFDHWNELPGKSADLIAFAHMTRTVIEQVCTTVMDESVRCIGARGLMSPYILERLHRDLVFYLRQPAPDAITMEIAEFFTQSSKDIHEIWS